MATEKAYLERLLGQSPRPSGPFGKVPRQHPADRPNPAQERVGSFYDPFTQRVEATMDASVRQRFRQRGLGVPDFPLAGPREYLWKDPRSIRAGVLTGGGTAPGLNRVIHSIVKRHYNVCGLDEERGGIVYGIRDGFRGLSSGSHLVRVLKLTPAVSQLWMDAGGTILGSLRRPIEEGERPSDVADDWLEALTDLEVDILYVIGGNGSLTAAHELYEAAKRNGAELAVAGLPKTMDNDILWTDQSFGYQSAIDEAARIIRALKDDAFATRRLCIVELFGRKSGFVAAAASLASGCVDAVLIPEEFENASFDEQAFCGHVGARIAERKADGAEYAVVVVAEGVKDTTITNGGDALDWLVNDVVEPELRPEERPRGGIFVNRPQHVIRAIPPNPFDRVFCERLADLAVDNALAGFTDFVVTRWMSMFALAPLRHVARETKTVDINGLFWKQVVNATGQPSFRRSAAAGIGWSA